MQNKNLSMMAGRQVSFSPKRPSVVGDPETKSDDEDTDDTPLIQSSDSTLRYDSSDPAGSSALRYIRRKSSTAKLALERAVRTRERVWSTALSSIVAAIPMLLVGYTIGYPSTAVLQLQALDNDSHNFSDTEVSLFGALASVGAMLIGPFAGWIADHWGRKNSLLLSGIPYTVGYLLIVLAQIVDNGDGFKALIMIGRMLTGFGLGWSCGICPIYIAEISSAKVRGIFCSFVQLALSIGLLIVYGLSTVSSLQYYHVAIVAIAIVLVFELLMVWSYETPRYLFKTGQKAKGIEVLEWLRGLRVPLGREINDMENTCSEKQLSFFETLKLFSKRSLLSPLVMLLFIMFFQQIGGLNAMSAYAAKIYKAAGSSNPQLTATYSIAVPGFVATVLAVLVIDLVGRRILLIVSGIGLMIGTVLLGTNFYVTRPSLCSNTTNATLKALEDSADVVCNTQYIPLAITGLVVFNVLFAIGWGPIPWILIPEFLPLQVRGIAGGLATFVNWGSSALVVGFYIKYAEAVQLWFAWWSFAVMNLLGVLFVIFFIPETKGKSLEELQQKFERKSTVKT